MATRIFLGKPPAGIEAWIKDHYGPKLDDPLCFTAVDAGATITFKKQGSPDAASIVYATESSGQRAALDWQPYTFNTMITLANVGDKVYFRAADENDITFYKEYNAYYRFATTSGKRIAASGNIQTLMRADGSRLDISGKTNCYYYMFCDCTSLTTAPALPATTLDDYCYGCMFVGCTSLTTAPALPATTLANGCYLSMFSHCTSLTQAPALPATTLASRCYEGMFLLCSSLTSAPELPATTLANYCYYNMFSDCTSLMIAPTLPAMTLGKSCYKNMFFNCPNVIEITFANLTCECVVANALDWGLGIDGNYHKFLVVAYCSDGVVVINDINQSSGGVESTFVKYIGDDNWTEVETGKKLTRSSIPDINSITAIKVGKGVTAIGADAFRYSYSLSDIELPDTIEKIGNAAFLGRTGFSDQLPKHLKIIADQAFNSAHIDTFVVPSGIKRVGVDAFNHATFIGGIIFTGKTLEEIQAMDNYPWGIDNTSLIQAG